MVFFWCVLIGDVRRQVNPPAAELIPAVISTTAKTSNEGGAATWVASNNRPCLVFAGPPPFRGLEDWTKRLNYYSIYSVAGARRSQTVGWVEHRLKLHRGRGRPAHRRRGRRRDHQDPRVLQPGHCAQRVVVQWSSHCGPSAARSVPQTGAVHATMKAMWGISDFGVSGAYILPHDE